MELDRKHIARIRSKGYEEGVMDGASEAGWIMTYGDLVTLVLTFFVLLLAISVPDDKKLREAMEEIQKALSISVDKPKTEGLENQLKEFIENENLANLVHVSNTTRGVKLSVGADFAFDAGKAVLKREQELLLDGVGQIISEVSNKIEISAHTDTDPISTEQFPSNWELSSARASAVANYLNIAWNLQGARITAIGRSEYFPKYLPPNEPENMERNRRVEIEIIKEGL